ncbi:PulJ/GspJ family protein [Acidisphaera rubrifaciens]|uniref:General secretion pathway protein J/pseudopilin J n=1 Tax=Acidisphaera rubrifaciens HS-AP3 TaxID=1231350 RepID=A0A0D6P6I9_9PROT|nr:prepilin-type N-terminal cleavage/methylation domain-containing protein [Acidisphaera rubrifaciens]GAN77272.1 general secretion pathway protein J/pseudopilin J [Acidisphaera rubrifaciens HS-AP3]
MIGRVPAAQRGFTLLEVMAALAVMGILLVALAEGSRFGFTAWGTSTRQIAAHEDLDAVDRAFRRMVAHIDPGTRDEAVTFTGGAHEVAFTTQFPAAPGLLAAHRVDVGIGVDRAHRLVLRWLPDPHAVRLVAPPPPAVTVLLDGVDHVDFAYWHNGAWVAQDVDTTPPALVRMHVVFRSGDPRQWPDIVAAPVREMADD